MPEPLADLLALPRIRAWLAARPPHSMVGTRDRVDLCPVAYYLNQHGYPHAEVGFAYTYPDGEDHSSVCEDTPEMVIAFIQAVDASGPRGICITAGLAIRLLDALEATDAA